VVLGRIVVVDSGGKRRRRRRRVVGGGKRMLGFAGSMWVGMVVGVVMRRKSDVVVGTVKDFGKRVSHKARGLGNGRTFCVQEF